MDDQYTPILLIDDDEDDYIITRDLITEIEGQQFNLEWAATYKEALERISDQEHEVYLVDYRLGEFNGLELIDQALKEGCTAPLILLTGQGDRAVDLEAMKIGAADYLVKDQLDAPLLERSIRYALGRKRAEEMRATLERQLRQAQKMEAIGRMAGGVAHDFNNLLTAVMSYAGLALASLPAIHPARDDMTGIQKTARRGAELTRQLLAFARKQVLEPRVIDPNELVLNLDRFLRRLISEDIELITVPEPEVGRIKVDPSQLEQVLVNLVVNACDAMPDGGALTIEVTNVRLDEEYVRQHSGVEVGWYVALAVSDNGIGMTQEVKGRIFEPFFTTKEQGKGTGLGLATVFGIVRQNDGHIWVYSEPGHGTTFKIYLPQVQEPANPVPAAKKQDPVPQGNETILLVEDEAAVRNLVARALRQQGYTVLEAANGQDALRLVNEQDGQEIHMLMTDVVMPKMGGKELADQLCTLRPNLRVLYTSGYTDKSIVHHYMLEPDIAFLQKPFSPESLAYKVREVMDS